MFAKRDAQRHALVAPWASLQGCFMTSLLHLAALSRAQSFPRLQTWLLIGLNIRAYAPKPCERPAPESRPNNNCRVGLFHSPKSLLNGFWKTRGGSVVWAAIGADGFQVFVRQSVMTQHHASIRLKVKSAEHCRSVSLSFGIFAVLAEFESELIRERAMA